MDTTEATLQRLFAAVQGAEHVLIVPHNNPDPDAIACAVALRYLLEQKCQLTATIAYKGIIGRAENRALVRYLAYPLQRMTTADLRTTVPIALVDTQPGVGNHPISATNNLAIVIDHHPWREFAAAVRFCDVRPNVGAASTILVEYLRAAELSLTPQLATALFYGIKSDTLDLMRSATLADRDAFCFLLPQVDLEATFKLDHAPLSPAYFKSLAETLQSAQVYNNVIVAFLGAMQYPDLTADMADLLLRMQDCRWVLCLGIYQDTLFLSVRTRNKRGAGQLVRTIVGDRGTAGGHNSMAGGQVPLQGADPEQLVATFSQQFIQALRLAPNPRGESLL
jgi:nanoRNase/pAp phosphatase (c-di-AMP/oligoRNAs hydrolase)